MATASATASATAAAKGGRPIRKADLVVVPELARAGGEYTPITAAPVRLDIPKHAVRLQSMPAPAGAPADYVARYGAAVTNWYVAPMWYTPAEARHIMDFHNGRNRPLSESWEKLRAKMDGGVWFMNAETVVFGDDGHLLNGQHRMKGCAEGSVPVMFLVVFGVNPDVFCTLDQTNIRRSSDVLAMSGYENCKVLSAALGWVRRHETGRIRGAWLAVPNEEAVSYMDEHADLVKSVEKVKGVWSKSRLYPASVLAFLHYQLSRVDAKAADKFFKKVVDGVGVEENTHEHLLRRRLEAEMGRVNHIGQYIIMSALTFKTWNNIRAGKPVGKAITWKRDGNEAFPSWESVSGQTGAATRRAG